MYEVFDTRNGDVFFRTRFRFLACLVLGLSKHYHCDELQAE